MFQLKIASAMLLHQQSLKKERRQNYYDVIHRIKSFVSATIQSAYIQNLSCEGHDFGLNLIFHNHLDDVTYDDAINLE